jgi:hypothetical protein
VTVYGKAHPDLGRHVLVADMAAVHPGDPNKCLCRGAAEVVVLVKGEKTRKLCDRALTAFRKQCAFRVIDTPQGPRWLPGAAPEEWGFALIFAAEMREFAWREEFRRRLGGCRCRL